MNSKKLIEKWSKHWDKMGKHSNVIEQVNRDNASINKDVDYLKKKLAIKKTDKLADFCCGNGMVTERISHLCTHIVGLDFSKKLIESTKQLYGKEKAIGFKKADITKTEFPDKSFDKVYCLTSFHYFPSTEYAHTVIEEMIRITKNNGKIIITDIPNKKSFWYLVWKIIRNPNPDQAIELCELRPNQSMFSRTMQRLTLILRRLTKKKVESDNWRWFTPSEFQSLEKIDVKIEKSNFKNKFFNYRFNIIITKS